jgi:hypothetical protein
LQRNSVKQLNCVTRLLFARPEIAVSNLNQRWPTRCLRSPLAQHSLGCELRRFGQKLLKLILLNIWPHRGGGSLKNIGGVIFDVVVGLTTIATLFYLAAITHILPVPESALGRVDEFSLYAWAVLLAGGEWLITSLSFLATFRGITIFLLICALVLSLAGRKIYRFFESIFGDILFWSCVLLIAILCVAGVAYAGSYLIPFEFVALAVLIFILVEYRRSRL